MESILTSVKKYIGIQQEYDHFDPDLISIINSVFATLSQLGVRPNDTFIIEDDTALWEDYLPISNLQTFVRQYVQLSTKQTFDPSGSGNVSEAIKSRIEQLEWRIQMEVEVIQNEEADEEDTNNEL